MLNGLTDYTTTGPRHASTCYVWPSSACPVGCQHCNYASPISIGALDRYSVAKNQDHLLGVVNGMGLWKAVLSGGGEPMVEPEFCAHFFANVSSPNLEELELITAAHFATSMGETRDAIRPLVDAWRSRPDHKKIQFRIRVSLDWFHAERIGVEPAANVIKILKHPDFADVDVYIRSVLLSDDDTTTALAQVLGAERNKIDDYVEELILPHGHTVLVYYKNLILDGRLTMKRLDRMPIGLPPASRAEEFGQRFRRSDGRQIPARTYNGPEVRHLDGLACLIEDDGRIRVLEGNDLSISPMVGDVSSWEEAITQIYRDPVSVFLIDEGPEALATLLAPFYPDAEMLAVDTNQLYHLAEMLLSSPDRRLTAMLLTLDEHMKQGVVTCQEPEWVDLAWTALEPYHARAAR